MKQVNKRELAKTFGVSLVTIDNWVRRGCPYRKKGTNGKEWCFDIPEVIRWREASLQKNAKGRVAAQGHTHDEEDPEINEAIYRICVEDIKYFVYWLFNNLLPSMISEGSPMRQQFKEMNIPIETVIAVHFAHFPLAVELMRHYLKEGEFERLVGVDPKICQLEDDELRIKFPDRLTPFHGQQLFEECRGNMERMFIMD